MLKSLDVITKASHKYTKVWTNQLFSSSPSIWQLIKTTVCAMKMEIDERLVEVMMIPATSDCILYTI